MVGIACNICTGNLFYNFPSSVILFSNKKIDYKSLEDSNLIILTGGEDISPSIYNQKNLFSYAYDEPSKRDAIEIEILKTAIELNKKILGICRGHQLINSYLGGHLIQDISKQLKWDHESYHPIAILENSIVTNSFIYVNSLHHQGVPKDGLGKGLIGTSFYNGVYESTESDNIITVQFHPEFMGEESNLFFKEIKKWANE